MSTNDRTPPAATTPSTALAVPGSPKRRLKHAGPRLQALEQRMMFDGAAVADALASVDHAAEAAAAARQVAAPAPAEATGAQAAAEPAAPQPPADRLGVALPVLASATLLRAGDPAADAGRREIAFIDSAVAQRDTLVQGLRAGVEVVLVDAGDDGLRQMAYYLEGRSGLDAVHLLSHGQAGEAVLGTVHLNAATLAAHAADLQRIGAALSADGDLLLYGCSVAQGSDGVNLLGQLRQVTGRDVAASTDTTGSADVGGNWTLEASTGAIEAPMALSAAGQAAYQGELALPGVHTGSNASGLFLGGNYIELGIRTNNSIGKFGADTNPGGSFTGRTNASNAAIAGIGMVGDADGFATGAVLNVDYFMPGTPEEGFYAGYKVGGVATTGKNFGTSVTNTSSGNTLSALVTGSTGSLRVEQAISFQVNDLFFKNTVTLTNTGASTLDNVRFMRSFDPDNTVDKSGSYSTVNTIERTIAAGDGVAVVSAKSSTGDTYYTRSGSKQATILYYSSDSRAKVGMATSGLAPSGVYDANVYDSSSAKGTVGTYDAYISIAFDVGSIAAGSSVTVTYYTSLDNRDIATILSAIAAADNKAFTAVNEDSSGGSGQTVNTVFGSAVAITAVDNTHGQWQFTSDGSSWTNFSATTGSNVDIAASARLLSTGYSVRFVPDADWNGTATVSYRVWNGSGFTAGSTADASSAGSYFSANAANATLNVNAVNDAPVLGGAAPTLAYTENAAATVVDSALTLTDVDASNFNGGFLQAQISSNGAAEDQLSVLHQGTGAGQIGVSGNTVSFGGTAIGTIDATFNGNNGAALKVALGSNATAAAVQALGRAIAYRDSSDSPSTATRSLTFTVNDGGNTGSGGALAATRSATITVAEVNDAPVASGTVNLPGITEDATSNSGALVSSFLSSTDADNGAVSGIAINGLVSSRGSWQFSLDNGATWTAVGSVSDAGALLLRSSDRVRYLPDALNADTASITYRAWDRTDQNNNTRAPGAKASVASNGGSTAYGAGTQTASITASAVNDAPVLTPAAPTLTSIDEDATSNAGQTVTSIVGSSISDVDSGAVQGIAITQLASGNGSWEYSTNGGGSWSAVGAVSQGSALLLRASDRVRFRPDGNNATTASFAFKAWDTTSGSAGTKADASAGGGTSAFSLASDTASISVTALNDAPVLSASSLTLAPITEDDTSNPGQTVVSLLGTALSDTDNGALQGVAITGSSVAGSGVWQVSLNNGGTWSALGAVSANAAMLLRAGDRVRFVPDTVNGGAASLTLCGWDQTSGTAGGTADTSSNGGGTAFSSATATAGLVVTALDDAPAFTTGASGAAFTENASTPVAVGSGITLQDDSANLTRATVRISAGFTAGDTLAVGTPGGLTFNFNGSTGVLTLSGSASVATYQAALRSVTYTTDSDDPTELSATRSLAWTATDSGNNTSSTSSSQVTLTPLADAPVLAGVPATWSYVEDDGERVLAPALTLTDADDGQVTGATVVILDSYVVSPFVINPGYLNDGYEWLSAVTTGTAITASWDTAAGQLTFSGTDSVANYQRVLRSVSYTNVRDYNNPAADTPNSFSLNTTFDHRNISFSVQGADSDGAGAGSDATAVLTVQIIDANEVPQVSNVQGNTAHIAYTEGAAAATLEGLLTVSDDGLVSTINSAFVRITQGLTDGDELLLTRTPSGWTRSGSATNGTLTNDATGTDVISYAWDAATGNFTLSTTSGHADQTDYTHVMQAVGFRSTSDDPTAAGASRTLIWRVTDTFGLQSAVTEAQTTVIDITAINDTATVAGLPAGGAIVFSEAGPDVTLAPLLALADADDSTLDGAQVVLSGSGFIAGVEYLSLPGSGAGSGTDWSLTNVGGSGIDAAYAWASGTLTLSNTASLAAYQAVLRQVRYGSVDDNPTIISNTRSLSITLTDSFVSRLTDADGGANDTAAGSAGTTAVGTVTLLPSNDRPLLAGLGGTINYTEGGSAAALAGSMTLADADDGTLASAQVWISSGFSAGDLLTVSSTGGLGVSYDSSTGVLTLSGTASKATYRTALRSVRFSSSSDDPSVVAQSRAVSWQITDNNAAGDGAMTSATGTSRVNVTATDDAATISGWPAANTIGFTENGSPVRVAPTLVLADIDDTQLAGASVAISSGLTSGDLLAVDGDLAGTGISASFSAGTLTLSGAASLADYQRALRSIVFSNTGDDPTAVAPSRTLTWTTVSAFASRLTDYPGGNDGASGITAVAGTSMLDVAPRNDAPTLNLVNGPAVYEQGSAAVFALRPDNTPGGVTLADADAADQIVNASVVITDNLLASDVLQVATPAGWARSGDTYSLGGSSITVAYNAGTGTLAFSGSASRADYATLLGHVQFSNSSNAPTASSASRTLVWTVTDSNGAGDGARSSSGSNELVIRDRNDAPTLSPSTQTIAYTEGDATVSLAGFTVADPDPGEVLTATVTLGLPNAGSLNVPVGASYTASTGVWTFSGSVADVNAALAALAFTPAGDNDLDTTVSLSVVDGGEDGAGPATASIALHVTAVNDAPVLTPASPVLPGMTEDQTTAAGLSVGSFRGAISDVDTGAVAGIALIDSVSGNGLWQYSLNSGSTWAPVGTVGSANALLLRDTDLLRFVPDGQNGTAASFSYRAWDRSSGTAGSKVDASTTGGTAAFSLATDTATLAVSDVNDAPVLSAMAPVLSGIGEDDIFNAGQTVASFLGSSLSDVDGGAVGGVAITASTGDGGTGRWQYSLDAGTTWADLGATSSSAARLLGANDWLRYVPDSQNGGTASLSYRGWDTTSGLAGGVGNTSLNGGSSAYSSATDSVSIHVAAVNDAPVLSPSAPALSAIDENAVDNPGQTVASILGSSATDVDSGAPKGMALVGSTAGNGTWQYMLDGGQWLELSGLSSSQALLLRSTDRVRFVPDAANATTATLTYRAWDQSSGTAGTRVDASSSGGSTAFSADTDTASVQATAVNDAPVMAAAGPVLPVMNEDDTSHAGLSVAALLGSSISDVDADAASGIAITGSSSGNGGWQVSLDAGANWVAMGDVSPEQSLLLRASDMVRFVPDGQNATSACFSYRAWDRSTGTAGDRVSTTANGGNTAFSLRSNSASVQVTSVNDAPVLSPSGPQFASLDEDALNNQGQTVVSLLGNRLSDVDTAALQGVAVIGMTGPGSGGHWDYLVTPAAPGAVGAWTSLGSVSDSQALLLRAEDRLRFVPDGQNAGTATLRLRGWDGSSGAAGEVADASVNGGSTAFSTATDTATVHITASNDAPVLAAAAPTLQALTEDAVDNAGQTVASILGSSITDADVGAVQGVALTGSSVAGPGAGRWQYRLDGSSTWLDVDELSSAASLLLRASDSLRFVPDGSNATTATLDYRAWDGSSGAVGSRAATTSTGGTSAFSSTRNTASVVVTSVNDAPVLAEPAPVLATLTEDAIDNAGQTVASILGNSVSDVDPLAQTGVAVTGAANGNGRWQYSLDGGSTWLAMVNPSAAQSLLLRANDRVRFVPDAMNATTASFSYRAWDQSSSHAGEPADTRSNGGSTAFSSGENTASITVTAVNDALINDAPPEVTGAARADGSLRQDAVVSATPGLWHDVDAGAAAPSYSYQWQVADDAAGNHLRNLEGATSAQLLLTSAQVGQFVRVRVVASDGVDASQPAFSAFQRVSNSNPVAGAALESPRATEALPYSYTLPPTAFVDANGEDTLHFSATLADGSPLPAWLHFDAASRSFSGTPSGGDIGVLNVRVQADDRGGAPASASFSITVVGVPSTAPAVAVPAMPRTTVEATLPLPAAPVAVPKPAGGGDGIATPETFTTAASASALASSSLTSAPITAAAAADAPRSNPLANTRAAPSGPAASDGPSARGGSDFASGYTRAEGFQVVVPQVGSNEPVLTVSKVPETVLRSVAEPLRYTLAPDTFSHTRLDAVVNLVAARSDGTALPFWMQFNRRNGSFTGVPPAGFTGEVDVLVTATDNFGNSKTVLVKISISGDGAPDKLSLTRQLRQVADSLRPAERLKRLSTVRDTAPAANAPMPDATPTTRRA